MPKAVVPVTWRLDPALFERVQRAARARGMSVQAFANLALLRAVDDMGLRVDAGADDSHSEDRAWLEADLTAPAHLEPFDWGPAGVPDGQPVRFVPGRGFVVGEGDHD